MKKTKDEYLFFILGYMLLVFCAMFNRLTILSGTFGIIKVISTLLLIISIIIAYKKINFRIIPALLLIITGVIVSYISKDYQILRLCLILIASKNIDFDKFIKTDYKVRSIFLSIVLMAHFMGLTSDYIVVRNLTSFRNSMGFSHPNTFGFYLMLLCFEYIYIKTKEKKKIKLYNYLILILTMFIIDYFSDSRSSEISLILLIIFIMFGRKIFDNISMSKTKKIIFSNSFIILAIISLYITHLVNIKNAFGLYINELSSGRFFYTNLFYITYGIKMFGQKLLLVSTEQAKLTHTSALVLDNAYMHILIRYGLVFFIIFANLFRKSFKRIFENKSFELFVIMFILLIYGLTEATIIRIEMCPFLLYLGNALFKKSGDKYESS